MSKLSKIFKEHEKEQKLSKIQKELRKFIKHGYYSFDYYSRHKTIKKQPIVKIIFNRIVNFYFENKFSRRLTYIIVFIILFTRIYKYFTKPSINSEWILFIALLICITSLFIQMLIFQFPYWQKLREDLSNPAMSIDIASEYNPVNHINTIESIVETNSIRDIKKEEHRFRLVIISQERAKNIADSAIPLISFLYAIFALLIFGVPKNWGDSLEIATFAGFGIVPLTTVIFSFVTELLYRNLLIYQHCLFILQEALITAEERETTQKNISVENLHEKYELILQELQNITKEIKKDNYEYNSNPK